MATWQGTPELREYGATAYVALNVGIDASLSEITTAWKRLMMQIHPDRSSLPDAKEHTQAVNQAYDILKDPQRRRHYDRTAEVNFSGAEHEESDAENEDSDEDIQASEAEEEEEQADSAHFPPPLNTAAGNFRIRSRWLLLTYPGLKPSDLTQVTLHAQLCVIFRRMTRQGSTVSIQQHVIGREVHKNPARATHPVHFHLVLELSHPLDTTNSRVVDVIASDGGTLHPNITQLKTELHKGNAIRYALKEGHRANLVSLQGDSIQFLYTTQAKVPDKKRKWGDVVKDTIAETSSASAAMAALWEADPSIYLIHAHQIRSNLSTVLPHDVFQPAELESFVPPWNEPFNFCVDGNGELSTWPRSVVLCGPPATGKTYRALAEFARPLLVTNSCLESLDAVVFEGPHATTHLVFDEFDYRKAGKGNSELTVEECLGLIQMELPITLTVRYKTVKVPPIPRIFTTNVSMEFHDSIFPAGANPNQVRALARRYRTVHVNAPMWQPADAQ